MLIWLRLRTGKANGHREAIREHTEQIAKDNGLEIEFIRKLDAFRKDDRIGSILEGRGNHPGLVHIFSAMESCTTGTRKYCLTKLGKNVITLGLKTRTLPHPRTDGCCCKLIRWTVDKAAAGKPCFAVSFPGASRRFGVPSQFSKIFNL